jgi:small subunit ribosomal protein S14
LRATSVARRSSPGTRRGELEAIIVRPGIPDAERAAAQRELDRQARDASATRVRNRDSVDGMPRGFLRKSGVSRVRLRGLAHDGNLPGVRKSSW